MFLVFWVVPPSFLVLHCTWVLGRWVRSPTWSCSTSVIVRKKMSCRNETTRYLDIQRNRPNSVFNPPGGVFDQTPSPAQDLDWITSREGHSMQRIFDGAVWGQSHPQRPGTPATHGMLRIQQNNHLHNTWHFFNLNLWVTVQLGYSLGIHCEPLVGNLLTVYVSTCFFLVFIVVVVCCLLLLLFGFVSRCVSCLVFCLGFSELSQGFSWNYL